jgi:hypothetical protein
MKKFLFFIGKILFLIIVMLFALDVVYTTVFFSASRRNKIEYVVNSSNRKYDVIMLGSSRSNNHFIAKMFEDEGLKAYNFGMSGARLQESALLLKLMIERNYKIKNVLIDIDLNINSEGYSEGTRAMFMPYLSDSPTISNYYKEVIPNHKALYYVPFYRYIYYDSKIGFREMFFSAIQKKSILLENQGYYPLHGKGRNLSYNMKDYFPKKNIDYEVIKVLCKENSINLIAVTTPICKGCNNFDYFKNIKKIYPEIHNYESYVSDDKFFSTCGHMNMEGAKLFTQKIIDDFFSK